MTRRRDQDDDREGEDQTDAHLAPPHEVADPEIEEGVGQRGDTVNGCHGDGRGVLAADDEIHEERRGDDVRERGEPARREDESEGKKEWTLRRLSSRVSARGSLRSEEHT